MPITPPNNNSPPKPPPEWQKPADLVIEGTKADDTIEIIEVTEDKRLRYSVNGQEKLSQVLQDDDIIRVDLSQGTASDYGDAFIVGDDVNLRNYNLLFEGSEGADFLAFKSGARLGNASFLSKGGDDIFQFGEGVSAKSLHAEMGNGNDTFQVLNRYQDEAYRHPTVNGQKQIDDRFTQEAIAEMAHTLGISVEELQQRSGLQVENNFQIDGQDGKDEIMIGSFSDAGNDFNIQGGDGADKITLNDHVGEKAKFNTLDGGQGNDWNWLGKRSDDKPVQFNNDLGADAVSIENPDDVVFSRKESIQRMDQLVMKFLQGNATEKEKEEMNQLAENPEISKALEADTEEKLLQSGYLGVRSHKTLGFPLQVNGNQRQISKNAITLALFDRTLENGQINPQKVEEHNQAFENLWGTELSQSLQKSLNDGKIDDGEAQNLKDLGLDSDLIEVIKNGEITSEERQGLLDKYRNLSLNP